MNDLVPCVVYMVDMWLWMFIMRVSRWVFVSRQMDMMGFHAADFSSLLLFKVSSLLRFPRVFRYAAYACVAVFVAVALAMGVVSQLLPVVERHPQQVADWLSVRAGQPVRFDTLSTSWTQRGPLLRLQGYVSVRRVRWGLGK